MSKYWRNLNIQGGSGLIDPKPRSERTDMNGLSKPNRQRIEEIKQNKAGIGLDSDYKEFWED